MFITGSEALNENKYQQILITDFNNEVNCRILSNKIDIENIGEFDSDDIIEDITDLFLKNNKLRKLYSTNFSENNIELFVAVSDNNKKIIFSYLHDDDKYNYLINKIKSKYYQDREDIINKDIYDKIEFVSSIDESSYKIFRNNNYNLILNIKISSNEKAFLNKFILDNIDNKNFTINVKKNKHHPGYRLMFNNGFYISDETNYLSDYYFIIGKVKNHNIKIRKLKENE